VLASDSWVSYGKVSDIEMGSKIFKTFFSFQYHCIIKVFFEKNLMLPIFEPLPPYS